VTGVPDRDQDASISFVGEQPQQLSWHSAALVSGVLSFTSTLPPDASLELFVDLPTGYSVAPVPEPSTWAMLLIGFAAIGFAGRWRNRNATLNIANPLTEADDLPIGRIRRLETFFAITRGTGRSLVLHEAPES
jgi:hypothetical protein